tara:strand:+ start:431 stop:1057 length:627 start_codon:yes stop_codon:yes gene_type:complete
LSKKLVTKKHKMKKILLFFLFPLFSFAQDTIIIKKVIVDADTVWQVKQITDADNSSLKVFADSNLIVPFLTNDLIDDARKMTDALNLVERQNKFIANANKLDKSLTNGKIQGSFDYLQEQFKRFWLGNYSAIANGTKVVAGAEIFVNQTGSLRIKIGESLNKPLIIISDTYGYISNYPNQGDKMVIYLTKSNVFKDFDNKLILRKTKE